MGSCRMCQTNRQLMKQLPAWGRGLEFRSCGDGASTLRRKRCQFKTLRVKL